MPATTRQQRHGETRFAERILEQLLRLRAAHALPLEPLTNPEGVHRWTFRAGGWPIQVDLDETVLEMRVYHDRQTVATGRVPANVMGALLGRSAIDAGGAVSPEDCMAALRAIVADWRRNNARVFMEPPRVARHPDGWNNA